MKPPQQAVDNGHDLTWDPPAALTSVVRWTCFRRGCGHAVLVSDGGAGHAYGSALDKQCPAAPDEEKETIRQDDQNLADSYSDEYDLADLDTTVEAIERWAKKEEDEG